MVGEPVKGKQATVPGTACELAELYSHFWDADSRLRPCKACLPLFPHASLWNGACEIKREI